MEKEKQHQLTDQKIKKAAKLLFSKKNPQNITVEEVCALAGVKRITFYHHFHSKDEFLLRSIQEILETEGKSSFPEILDYALGYIDKNYPMFVHLNQGGFLHLCTARLENALAESLISSGFSEAEISFLCFGSVGIIEKFIALEDQKRMKTSFHRLREILSKDNIVASFHNMVKQDDERHF